MPVSSTPLSLQEACELFAERVADPATIKGAKSLYPLEAELFGVTCRLEFPNPGILAVGCFADGIEVVLPWASAIDPLYSYSPDSEKSPIPHQIVAREFQTYVQEGHFTVTQRIPTRNIENSGVDVVPCRSWQTADKRIAVTMPVFERNTPRLTAFLQMLLPSSGVLPTIDYYTRDGSGRKIRVNHLGIVEIAHPVSAGVDEP